MRTMSTVLFGAMAILLVSGFFVPSLSDEPLAVTPYATEFDRVLCEQSCRTGHGYGVWPYGWGGRGGDAAARRYQTCVDACNRAFWKDFDGRMKNLDK